MPERYAEKCSQECDFVIAVQGYDSESIAPGFEAYDSCPSCGADLERVTVVEGRTGVFTVIELDEGDA